MFKIKIDNLAIGYDKVINENISFEIVEGSFNSLVGENGAGKSTLLKTLLGLIKPLKGEVVFEGDISKKDIGYMPQQSPNQATFVASVEEVILSGLISTKKFFSFYNKEDYKKLDNVLNLLEISHLKNKCFKDLSGGEQQRVLIARALIAQKKVLILDEPTNSLDIVSRHNLHETLHKLNHQKGVTIIMVSHNLDECCNSCMNIIELTRGGVIERKHDKTKEII